MFESNISFAEKQLLSYLPKTAKYYEKNRNFSEDRNNNKILDTGLLSSKTDSEKFYVYADSLVLRTNWELEIKNWEIN